MRVSVCVVLCVCGGGGVVCLCGIVCVCVWPRRGTNKCRHGVVCLCGIVCVCVCVWRCVSVWHCVCVCVWRRGTNKCRHVLTECGMHACERARDGVHLGITTDACDYQIFK